MHTMQNPSLVPLYLNPPYSLPLACPFTHLTVWRACLVCVLCVATQHPAQHRRHGVLNDLLPHHTPWVLNVKVGDPRQWTHALTQIGLDACKQPGKQVTSQLRSQVGLNAQKV